VLLFTQAWKELRAEKRFALLFLFNLALGLSGLVSMEAFRNSLSQSLAENAQSLLGADAAVSSRRPFSDADQKQIERLRASSQNSAEVRELFSMVRTEKAARLVMLKGLGAHYPLRGSLTLKQIGVVDSARLPALLAGENAWADPELGRQLGLKIGDSIQLGKITVKITDFIELDPTQGFRGFASSGRIFLSLDALMATGLISPQSTVTYTTLFQFAKVPSRDELRQWRFEDPGLHLRSAEDAAGESGRLLDYLADFLGLSALVALFLSSLGSAYLFRTWLVRRSRSFALHRVLGLRFLSAAIIPALQALLLSFAAVPLALLFGLAELRALSILVKTLAPVEVAPHLSASSVAVGFLIAAAGSVLTSLPFLLSLRSQPTRELLGGKLPEPKLGISGAAAFIPASILFYGLAVYECQSFRTAGIFFASLVSALAVLLLAGLAFLYILGRLLKFSHAWPWPLRQGLIHLSRRGFTSVSAFVALALAALLLNLLPQLRSSIGSELETSGRMPSFFLFDIQEEQLAPVEEALKEKQIALQNISPLVRAKLLQVNGENFERASGDGSFRTREEEMEARFRNRGFNLSFRPTLRDDETLLSGRAFQAAAPEISLEQNFAERLGLKLGDKLRFDVQGVEVDGTVVNLRSVRWASFRPNFFVLFNEGVLEGAPKTYLGGLPELSDSRREEVQDLLALKFPNVSAIDVRATVAQALELTDRMKWALNLMSAISLFAGAVVLFAIAYRQAELRRWDINLMKILGARAGSLRQQLLFEFALLAGVASLFGAILSVGFAWCCAFYFFDGAFRFSPAPLALSVAACTAIALVVAAAGASQVWRRNPAELLAE
jgi:putative ABC transport system permease protein